MRMTGRPEMQGRSSSFPGTVIAVEAMHYPGRYMRCFLCGGGRPQEAMSPSKSLGYKSDMFSYQNEARHRDQVPNHVLPPRELGARGLKLLDVGVEEVRVH